MHTSSGSLILKLLVMLHGYLGIENKVTKDC